MLNAAACLVLLLGADHFGDRQRADVLLQRLGWLAYEDIREAAEQSEDAEVRWRAARLLLRFEPEQLLLPPHTDEPPRGCGVRWRGLFGP